MHISIDKSKRANNKEIDDYIESLESYITDLGTKNIFKLLMECDETAAILADDVRLLRTESDDEKIESELKMLGSKKNKRFEAFLALVKQLKDFNSINDMINGLKPKNSSNDVVEKEIKPVIKKTKNIQDFVFNS